MDIQFTHGGKDYKVDRKAYDLRDCAIKLPGEDGVYLLPEYWLERMPPIPMNFREVAQAEVVDFVEAELVA